MMPTFGKQSGHIITTCSVCNLATQKTNNMNNQPFNWPASAPAYRSVAGWEYEKLMAYKALAYKIKDDHANRLIVRCEIMCEYAISAIDEVMFWKYHIIGMRLIQYRIGLLNRYKPVSDYGKA